jgi:hypothetical protein
MTDTTDEPTGGQDPLGQARSAVEAGSFQEALTALTAAGPAASTAEGIELLAHAAYGAGEFERAVGAFEDLHALHLAAGELVEAGRAAALVAMYLMMDTGLMTPVRAWLRRAERMVADRDDTPVHALIAMTRTYERLMSGDVEAAALHARQAVELGERHGVQPAVIIGSVAGARMHIFRGDIETGLDELDDIAVTLLSGAVDSLTTGMALCELICAMQGLAMYDRAAEWTQAMEQWRQGTAFGGINGRCRVHRAEMLRVSGPCDEAEEEALRACEELRPWMRREFGWPLAELGNIRLRKGLDAPPRSGARASGPGRRHGCRCAHRRGGGPPVRRPVQGAPSLRPPPSGSPARRPGRGGGGRRRPRHRPRGSRRTRRHRDRVPHRRVARHGRSRPRTGSPRHW